MGKEKADPKLYSLDMTDTEYAALVAKGYEPDLEQLMIDVGEEPNQARKLTQLVGLTKDKPLETDEEWNEFMEAWAEVAKDERLIQTVAPTTSSTPY